MTKPAKIRVEHLHKIFGKHALAAQKQLEKGASKDDVYRDTKSVVAVADVSFSVQQGQVFVVMGLSGSGKSTLIRCLNRLIAPTSGHIYIDDEDILQADKKRLRELRRNKLTMVFQHFALFPHMTVGKNVEYGLKIQGMKAAERQQKALQALDQVNLRDWADTLPEKLSGGMQQRVGLARGLAANPEILLMDEPFSALDPLIRREMQQELLSLQHRLHKTIIFITHDLHEALILGDQIAIMKDGRFVQVGNAKQIVTAPADPYVAAFTQDVDRSRVFTLSSIMKKTPTLVEDSSVDEARSRLAETDANGVYVLNANKAPVGLLLSKDLNGRQDSDLSTLMRTDFPTGKLTTPLIETYGRCAAGLPIAVIDDHGRLCGTVNPLEVFTELAAGNSAKTIS